VIDLLRGKTPPGWLPAGDVGGVPLWKRDNEACYVATGDMDQLRFLNAALAHFDEMSGAELHAFIHATPRREDPRGPRVERVPGAAGTTAYGVHAREGILPCPLRSNGPTSRS
jgi:hypothetical protein